MFCLIDDACSLLEYTFVIGESAVSDKMKEMTERVIEYEFNRENRNSPFCL